MPRRARLNMPVQRCFNEAEARCLFNDYISVNKKSVEGAARAPRMLPSYKPLRIQAISPHFRPIARRNRK